MKLNTKSRLLLLILMLTSLIYIVYVAFTELPFDGITFAACVTLITSVCILAKYDFTI